MMYFVDFDRTLFDTERFFAYLSTLSFFKDVYENSNGDKASMVAHALQNPDFAFKKGELAPFLYEDAAAFLREKENSAMIITFGNPVFQKAKVVSAVDGIPRVQALYTGNVRKGEFIAPHLDMYGPTPTFIDDAPLELGILNEHCPTARLFEMRRDGGEGSGDYTVIRSLRELP
ncbi:MAG: hypothetical protein KBC16_02400 [Candidatus Pacebacteria bacterium]|nr:hypothetical protein [Candidatus Paceibacterota bacterium]